MCPRLNFSLLIKIAAAFSTLSFSILPGQEMADLKPFLNRHCFDCHSDDSAKGGLNLETFSTQLDNAEAHRRWVFLHDRVASGEMPPKEKYKPTEASRDEFLGLLGSILAREDPISHEPVLRRLNHREYENTVRDLFGIFVDVKRILPDDSTEQGFDNSAAGLSVSAEQMMAYLEAADQVLDRVFGSETQPVRIHRKMNLKDSRTLSSSDPRTEKGAKLFSRRRYTIWETAVPGPGHYRLRLKAEAIQTDTPVFVNIWNGTMGQIEPHPAGFFAVKPGQPTAIELTDWSPEPSDSFAIELPGGYSQYKVPKDFQGPGLLVSDVEILGPLESWPPKSLVGLLGSADPLSGNLHDARAILFRILPRAFRRPVDESEVNRYLALVKAALEERRTFAKALRRGLKGILCSPEFLYLEEKPGLEGFSLASRLSYFLWQSMPDDELFLHAKSGNLLKPEVLRSQTERLLADKRSDRFVESFTGQWLRLRDIDFTVPDHRLYPEYNQLLRRSMLVESRAFFREILDGDLSVANFIDSDFVMINQPLAEFYRIDGVEGLEMRRVEIPKDHVRGGVLTQASVLKVSADGTRTSPVLRGVWILKHLYGTPSPPPPSEVGAIEPDVRGSTTIREQLAKHREHQSCNRCHRKIDPPGFALESFDVIGAERDWYRVQGGGKWIEKKAPNSPINVQYRRGPDVDSSGVMPDGRSFSGIREYKKLLLEDETEMPRALTGLMMGYALGRSPGFSDRKRIEKIVVRLPEKNYGLRSLIHEIVQSELIPEAK